MIKTNHGPERYEGIEKDTKENAVGARGNSGQPIKNIGPAGAEAREDVHHGPGVEKGAPPHDKNDQDPTHGPGIGIGK